LSVSLLKKFRATYKHVITYIIKVAAEFKPGFLPSKYDRLVHLPRTFINNFNPRRSVPSHAAKGSRQIAGAWIQVSTITFTLLPFFAGAWYPARIFSAAENPGW
jgi:hypothetical protein